MNPNKQMNVVLILGPPLIPVVISIFKIPSPCLNLLTGLSDLDPRNISAHTNENLRNRN